MSFFQDPIGNISGGIHDLGKSTLGKMAETAALAYFMGPLALEGGALAGMSTAGLAGLAGGTVSLLNGGNLMDAVKSGGMAYLGGKGFEAMGGGTPTGGANYDINLTNPAAISNPSVEGATSVTSNVAGSAVATPQWSGLPPDLQAIEPQATATPLQAQVEGAPVSNAPVSGAPAEQSLQQQANDLQKAIDYSNNPTALPKPPTEYQYAGAGVKPASTGIFSGLKDKFMGLEPWQQAGVGAAGLMALKGMAKNNSVAKAPDNRKIKYYGGNPYSGASFMREAPVLAATGGIVALANGGTTQRYDDGGITASDVANYLQANPGMSDAQISAAMDQYKVNPALVAQATGLNVGDVQSRYNAADTTGGYATGASGVSNNSINQWLGQNPTASDSTIYNAMQQYGITPQQMAAATGNPLLGEGNVMDRYSLAQNILGQGNIFGQAPVNNTLGSTYDQQWAAYMDAHKDASGKVDPIAVKEMARATGISEAEIAARYAAAEAKLHPPVVIKDPKTDIPINTTTNTNVAPTTPMPGSLPNPATTATNAIQNTPSNTLFNAVSGNTGAGIEGGGTVVNPNGTITESPVIPGIPKGGVTGMKNVRDIYTSRGGNLGYVNPTPVAHNIDPGTQHYLNMLSGNEPMTKTPYTSSGVIASPYYNSVMGLPLNPKYEVTQPGNPHYDPAFSASADYIGDPQTGLSQKTLDFFKAAGVKDPTKGASQVNSASAPSLGTKTISIPVANGTPPRTATQLKDFPGIYLGDDGKYYDANGNVTSDPTQAAKGGLMALAGGGMSGMNVGTLGGYSDGGRLLRGPGDGISDSIPATIGAHNPQPARLADGEFVVPARIVSELGNGSTEAGARKLYQMMDRVQNARKKTVGKHQVAANPRAEKYLPA